MVLVNYTSRELTAKLVYYGPGLCGKTTNLQYVFDNLLPKDRRGKMVSLATETDRTLFFDFLPLEIGSIRGLKTRLQLYTVPGQVHYNAIRKTVLKGADGIVFVADSQVSARAANLEAYENMKANLREHGLDPRAVPLVFQFNKRDLPEIMAVDQMEADLNEQNVPFFEATAIQGIGVEDTLKGISKLVLKSLANRFAEREAPAAGAAPASVSSVAPPAARAAEPAHSAPSPFAAGAPPPATAMPFGGSAPHPVHAPMPAAAAAPLPAWSAPATVAEPMQAPGPLELELGPAASMDDDVMELEEAALMPEDGAGQPFAQGAPFDPSSPFGGGLEDAMLAPTGAGAASEDAAFLSGDTVMSPADFGDSSFNSPAMDAEFEAPALDAGFDAPSLDADSEAFESGDTLLSMPQGPEGDMEEAMLAPASVPLSAPGGEAEGFDLESSLLSGDTMMSPAGGDDMPLAPPAPASMPMAPPQQWEPAARAPAAQFEEIPLAAGEDLESAFMAGPSASSWQAPTEAPRAPSTWSAPNAVAPAAMPAAGGQSAPAAIDIPMTIALGRAVAGSVVERVIRLPIEYEDATGKRRTTLEVTLKFRLE